MKTTNLIALLVIFAFAALSAVACAAQRPPAPGPAVPPGGTAAPKPDWELKWEKTLQEARKEGVVYVYGPPLPEVREGLTSGFARAYPGMKLDYVALGGGEIIPRIKSEYDAGIHNVDLVVSGTTTILTGVRPYTQAIKPFLVRPEITDPRAWLEGKLEFADKTGEINLVFTYTTSSWVVYNTNLVDPKKITSWWDLVKPEWKGKITFWDPAVPGAGQSATQLWFLHPDLGPAYFKAFVANEPVITRDTRMQVETVGRGKYSIAVAPSTGIVVDLQKAGMPIKYTRVFKEGAWSTASFGSVAVMAKPPNPNAATVFLNWMLGKEGQTVFATKADYFSRRLDVPSDTLDESMIPEPGASYMSTHTEDVVMKARLEAQKLWERTIAGK
ncbi:MAG: extracellular solute-binding protein [Chloroflexi bacterium]|nr:extracellular solute-binding protein [Chloroflexota bacterium]